MCCVSWNWVLACTFLLIFLSWWNCCNDRISVNSGVPGMAARVAGAHHVVLTEQDELLRLLRVNLAANAEVLTHEIEEEKGGIVARPLSWGIEHTKEYLARYGDEKIDVILSCDCIYEPLYGTSWKGLAQTMELLCLANPKSVVLLAVERRNEDGIDKFLAFVEKETMLLYRRDEVTVGSSKNRLEVYHLHLENILKN
uniref:Secreted RxLR effector protein 48 n=1 Tax=Plasmopara viticola TaxID=143451 RepID=RLR48_PLAVT|nr:RecName: Full=Secreted RxLR effector protein 48; Flags: Precursor [Plasmopara viticola]